MTSSTSDPKQNSVQFIVPFSCLDLTENLAERADCADHRTLGVNPEVSKLLRTIEELCKLTRRRERPTTRDAVVNTSLLARDLHLIAPDLTDLLERACHCTLPSPVLSRSIFG